MPTCLEEMFSPTKMEARTSEKGLRSVGHWSSSYSNCEKILERFSDGEYVVQIVAPVPSSWQNYNNYHYKGHNYNYHYNCHNYKSHNNTNKNNIINNNKNKKNNNNRKTHTADLGCP